MSDSDTLGDGGKLLFCSFCGKNQHEVRRLIAGPSFISAMNVSIYVMTLSREETQVVESDSSPTTAVPTEIKEISTSM